MVNLAIIGLGRWGRVLVDAVQGKTDLVQFTNAVTRTPSKVEDYCKANSINLTSDYSAILSDPKIDGVVLATPHSQHEQQIIDAVRARKHVFCEKPVTLTRKSINKAMTEVEKSDVIFAAGHNRRFLPALKYMNSLIRDGDLGRILHIEGNMSGHVGSRYTNDMWRVDPNESPAGGMAGSGIHVIDAMIYLLGPIKEVSAQSFRLVNEINLDDTTNMLFRFENGKTGYLVALTATTPTFRIQVFGEQSKVELIGENILEIQPVNGVQTRMTFPSVSTEFSQLVEFANCIVSGGQYPISIDDVRNGVAVFEAVSQSCKERRWISV